MLPKFHLNINVLSVLKNPQQSHSVIYSESIRELEKSPEPYYFACLIIYSIFKDEGGASMGGANAGGGARVGGGARSEVQTRGTSSLLLQKEVATYSSILAWRIPWTEEPGWLQSTGWQRVGHN